MNLYLVLGFFLLCVGGLMAFAPAVFYELTQGWKNDSSSEPSRLYVISTRIGGIFFCAVGVTAFIIQFVS